MKRSVFLIVCLISLSLINSVSAEEVLIQRTVSTQYPMSGSEMEVKLSIQNFSMGGIVENIPDGFIFNSTSLPPNQVCISGQKIAFAVIDENEIYYTIKIPETGGGLISGEWKDYSNENAGIIKNTPISVSGTSGQNDNSVRYSNSMNLVIPLGFLIIVVLGFVFIIKYRKRL